MGLAVTRAIVITVSDGVAAGVREDISGSVLESLLVDKGFSVDRVVVADEVDEIAGAIKDASSSAQLVVTTGGTGFSHRDVTPEATASVLEKEAPGLVHAMLAGGLEKTPMAALTRARAGSIGETLVINVPGSPRGATESLEAVLEVIPHAIQLLSGDTQHH
ncbi:MAG: MogA/MoaB family molybdenum cofactor biosynthesis protein [Acidobacteria bacterium]|nr:MogA/MoaB family molybdenum cofactor biosynthesis protein [Acidobacteriota bacterium]TDI48992.1 MAG: MogA/MoaB family molybdenum cofactor biosynthesis protein [Acidobacteriota bacterium]